MNHIRLFLVVAVLFIIALTGVYDSYAKEARFDHFDTRDGLSQNNINSLVVDSIGYIWIGTLDGLTRFDGTDFKIFRPSPGDSNAIRGNYVSHISISPNGCMWVYTRNGGMNIYDGIHEKFFSIPDSCFDQKGERWMVSMVSESDSSILFTDEDGLYRYYRIDGRVIPIDVPFPNGLLLRIKNEHYIYWGQGGLYDLFLGKNDSAHYKMLVNSPIERVSNVFNDSLVIVGTKALQILNLECGQARVFNNSELLKKELHGRRILSIAANDNEVWVGLDDGLLFLDYNDSNEELTKYSYDPFNSYSFQGKDALNLCFDRAGNLWIGTSKYGLNLFNREKNLFEHHKISLSSKSDQGIDPVRAICKTVDGSSWIGFDRLGLVRIKPNGDQQLFEHIYLPNNQKISIENVRSIFEDDHQNLWIGTSYGVCIYNETRDRIESALLAFGWEWKWRVYFIGSFEKDQLIITSPEGVAYVDLNNMTLHKMKDSEKRAVRMGNRPVRCMDKDQYGNYWMSFDNAGLIKLTDDRKIKSYNVDNVGLIDNKIYSLCSLGDTLWIATNGGLMSFDLKRDQTIRTYYQENGLVNNLVYSIISEPPYLWLSTNRGISRMDTRNYRFENYLTDELFMDDAYFKDHDGIIYFGGYDGYISFNSKKLERKKVVPKPEVTQLLYKNKSVVVGENIEGKVILPVSISNLRLLELNHNLNSFSLSFDAFPFSYPDHTQFRYRLNGLSDEWILAVKNENRAVFTNLPPDNYNFEVQASLNGYEWSESRILPIYIIPPFWKKLWFRTVFLSFLLVIGIILFQLRLYTIKLRNKHLEEKVNNQTRSIEDQKNKIIAQKEEMVELSNRLREADHAKLKFYTNVSHEFRTPLTIIMGNLETLKEQVQNQALLKNIKRSTERLYRLVNQFIDLRRYDQGELKVAVSEFDIVLFTKDIAESFQELASRKNVELRIGETKEPIPLWLDKDKTDKILYNLISNAIKYTEDGGLVSIRFEKKEEGLELIISDTGVGIPEEELNSIFKGFYRGEKTRSSTDGHGLGLALVKALVEAQKASILCDSRSNEGTTFRILFRWGNLHFNEEEIVETENIEFFHHTENKSNIFTPESSLFGKKILLVEDNTELLDYLSNLFGKYYQVFSAINGKDALRKLSDTSPDLIITDLMMPVMDGLELSKQLKKQPETRFIPLIILSAKVDVSSKIEGIKLDIDDYIEKPFHPALLLAKVDSILKKRENIKKNIEHLLVHKESNEELTENNRLFIERVMLVLDSNYSDPSFSVNQLSAELFMSRVTFYRKMKEITGEGPGEFIRKYRLKEATLMLTEGAKTVGEVCIDVGFQSLSHFRKSFKEEYGVSPSMYINTLS